MPCLSCPDMFVPPVTQTPIPNPLRAYVLPEDLAEVIASSDCFNPDSKPNYEVGSMAMPVPN